MEENNRRLPETPDNAPPNGPGYETGDVNVTGMPDSNPILSKVVRDAVNQWKFIPIRDASGLRCVDTEIPLALKFRE